MGSPVPPALPPRPRSCSTASPPPTLLVPPPLWVPALSALPVLPPPFPLHRPALVPPNTDERKRAARRACVFRGIHAARYDCDHG